jgi:hypothetical protein
MGNTREILCVGNIAAFHLVTSPVARYTEIFRETKESDEAETSYRSQTYLCRVIWRIGQELGEFSFVGIRVRRDAHGGLVGGAEVDDRPS